MDDSVRREYKREWQRRNADRIRGRRNELTRQRRVANPAKYLAQEAAYRERNRELLRQRRREYVAAHPERVKQQLARSRDKRREYQKAAYQQIKREVIAAYGGKCVCCGEQNFAFLTIDHVFNDGYLERGKEGRFSGVHIYRRLKRAGMPQGRYQVLCYNCNCSKQHDPEGHMVAHPNAYKLYQVNGE